MSASFTVTPADAACRALLLGRTANRASISPRTGSRRTVTVNAAAVDDLDVYVYCTHATLKRSIEKAVFTVLDPACSQALAVGGVSAVAVVGRWNAGCVSSLRGNARTPFYAMSYTFTLSTAADVTVALAPDGGASAYLDLLPAPGSGADPPPDFGTGPRVSVRGLAAGTHTIETTHRDERTEGGFTLTVAASASVPGWVKGLDLRHEVVVGELFSTGWTYGPPGAALSVESVRPSGLSLDFADTGVRARGISGAGVSGKPTHAGNYTVTLALAQPGRVDKPTFTVEAACPRFYTRRADRVCEPPEISTNLQDSYTVTVGETLTEHFTFSPAAAKVSAPSVSRSGLSVTVEPSQGADFGGLALLEATPALAGTYTVTVDFTQRLLDQTPRTDPVEFNIVAECPIGKAPSLDGSRRCEPTVATPTGCAATALPDRGRTWWGRLNATAEFESYDSRARAGCTSLSQPGHNAAYWSLSVPSHAAETLSGTITLEAAATVSPRQPSEPPSLVGAGGSPSVTLWKLTAPSTPAARARAQRRVQRVASAVARKGTDPVIASALPGGDYLIEIAPTGGTVGRGSYRLAVTFPTAPKVHNDVQTLGNTGRNRGLSLEDFLDARGSLCYGEHPTRACKTDLNDPFDPPSADYPWLPFITDECSIPQGWVQALQRWLNAEIAHRHPLFTAPQLIELAEYIRDQAPFDDQTVWLVFACMRHDFNWRNLYRVEHHLDHEGAWNKTTRKRADDRFNLDLKRLCDASLVGSPVRDSRYAWELDKTQNIKCNEVADAMRIGVGTVPMTDIHYGPRDV